MPRKKPKIVTDPKKLLEEALKLAESNPDLLKVLSTLKDNTAKPTKKKKPVKRKQAKVKESVNKVEEVPQEEFVKPKSEKTTAAKFRKYVPPKGPNKFVDDGKSCRDEEDERLKKLNVIVQSHRPEFRHVDVKCSDCGKKVSVHPMYNTEFFRCDQCVRRV